MSEHAPGDVAAVLSPATAAGWTAGRAAGAAWRGQEHETEAARLAERELMKGVGQGVVYGRTSLQDAGCSAVALARSCIRCCRPLSRYNAGDYCGGCATSGVPAAGVQASAGVTEIGARLRAARHRRGMTLEVLGGLAGLSGAYLSMVENGKRRLDRYSMIITLADALRVLPAELAPALGTACVIDPAEVAVLASQRLAREISLSGEKECVIAELTPPDWAKPVEKALVALWDAVDAADQAVLKTLRDHEPANGDLQRFSSEFRYAKDKLISILLGALSPDEASADTASAARAVS